MATKSNLFNESINKASLATLGKDKGFINSASQTSIVSRASGSTSINSGLYAQIKCDKASGVVTEIALQSVVNAVQRELTVGDLIINRHKLNSQLFEFTNLKANMGTIMGDLTVNSTILVKVWEPALEKYVLIRRPARFPVFSHLLDAYTLDERLCLGEEDVFLDDIEAFKTELNNLQEDVDEIKEEEEKEGLEEWWDDTKENVSKWWDDTKEVVSNAWDNVTDFFTGEDDKDNKKDNNKKE